jgi:basic membrane protein A
VDADQWAEAPGHVLTSMTKQVDVAVYETILALKGGIFSGGVRAFGLKEGGVDYVYDDHNRGFIPAAARQRVEALRQQLIAGALTAPTERGL